MAHELYGAQRANVPRDPLRLAEEFRAGLGDAALADFLRRRIRDDAFEPGQIHLDLLNLPWADVLTTNYDTLLERAAKDARRGYDLVLAENDLAHAGGPRIIKLHGSLRDGAGVVLSEEDYRSYPERQAAFVNTARQVFIENELCLLGFSGDDPNFLQWAGWVRDRLGGRARRIYLVGALNLPPVKRRLLESRGIAPIDFAPAVEGERADRRHATAISLFLEHLKAAQPAEPGDWKPAPDNDRSLYSTNHETWSRNLNDPEKVVEAFRKTLVIWRKDRQFCPRWLVCPRDIRELIRQGTSNVENLLLAVDTLPENERRDALLELAWRYDRGAQPLPPWLAERMDAISTPEALAEADPEQIGALARVLLGAARLADDEAAFATRTARFEALAAPSSLSVLVAYERCLFARSQLDFAFVAENVSKIDGDDPVWELRRAALLYWVGETAEAQRRIGSAARQLRARVLRDPDSVALRSRFAWVKMLARALRWEDKGALLAELDGLDRLALRNYDPWEQLHAVDGEVDEGLRKRLEARQIEPGFEAGSYRDSRNIVTLGGGAQVTPLSELRHIAEQVGLPIRSRYMDLLGTRLANALRLNFEPTAAWHAAFLSTEPSYSKGPIDIHLGRIPIARLRADVIVALRMRLERAIAFWRARIRMRADRSDDVEALRLFVEALSRVAARNDADTAKAHVRLAVDMANDNGLNHWWLSEPIGDLLRRAFDAVPADERSELSSELLRFPLASEKHVSEVSPSWYEPGRDTYRSVQRTGNEVIFDARVSVFLQNLAPGGLSRPEAAVRLLHLYERAELTSGQIASFADALWKNVPKDNNALPECTRLLLHAFLIAPAPPGIDARARVYANLFARGADADPVHLVSAASGRTPTLLPNEEDAVRLFDNVTGWRPKRLDPNSVSDVFDRPAKEQLDRMMASILGIAAAPALAPHDRTVDRAETALIFVRETDLPEGLAALPIFYGLNADIDSRIEKAFCRPLAKGDRRATPITVDAIDRWLRLSELNQVSPLPEMLRERVLRALERGRTGGLAHLIYLVRRIIDSGLHGDPELDRIVEVLDELRAATNYGSPDGDANVESDWAISLPLVRAECVRLARVLEQKGVTVEPVRAWCELAACDPLPEVRNAANITNNQQI